jgi:uncharacterized protein YggE
MKRAILAFSFVTLWVGTAGTAPAQESGNRVYGDQQGQGRRRTAPFTGDLLLYDPKDQTAAPYVEAYVMMNVKADSYVAVFGVAQEGPTAVESNRKVDAQIAALASALQGLGIARTDLFVDFISQNPVYDYTVAGKTAREALTGFQTKKTVAVRYKDRALFEQMVAAAASASIFDLIKVDYVVADTGRVRARLLDEAGRIVREKVVSYGKLLGINLRPRAVMQEKYDTLTPGELYRTYTAYESGSVDGASRVVDKRKSSTSYYDPLEGSEFDAVIDPAGIEPTVQCTLFLKVRCEWAPSVVSGQ